MEQITFKDKRWYSLQNLPNEIWMEIKGYEGCYSVSNYGRIKSLERLVESGNGLGLHKVKENICHAKMTRWGYLDVSLARYGKMKTFRISRIVASSFIDNPLNKREVDHINTIRHDNRVSNLRWVTTKENHENPITKKRWRESYKPNGLGKFGKDNARSIPIFGINILSGEVIFFDCINETQDYDFCPSHVVKCLKGKSKSHKGYKWYYKDEYERIKQNIA